MAFSKDEYVESYNDTVYLKGMSKKERKQFVPELLRRKYIYSRYFKKFDKYKPSNEEDWAELHVCTLKKTNSGDVFMYDNQTLSRKSVNDVQAVISYIPWFHTVCKLKILNM